MGLLDGFEMPGIDTPQGQGLLAASLSLMGAQKMPGQRGALGSAIADAGKTYMATRNQAGEQLQTQEFKRLQLDALKRKLAQEDQMRKAAQSAFRSPEMANAMSQGPMPDGSAVPTVLPGFDTKKYTQSLYGIDPLLAMDFQSKLNKEKPLINVAPGGTLYDQTMGKAVFTSPKESATPSAIQEYNFAKGQGYQGSFTDYQTGLKKAGATNIGMPKIDIKMGDSVASQIGPIGSASRIKAEGAVTMFDAADRVQKALDSGNVSSGPGTSAIQTVRQLAQKVSGGNDNGIRQTQQVIRALAKMAVEARKQLAGQGQVTENEARAVEKADAGNIDDLTTGELQDLVTLTKRSAHYTAKSHQEFLSTMQQTEGTRGAAPFYKVRGLDPLLNHVPKLPQIGGGDIRGQADAILRGK